ncbi:MAG TPA: ABC transporter permease, partial [Vicinamibacterales bacterium]|nr:ABC transporter permease [Vicinamibacterales bacterium]
MKQRRGGDRLPAWARWTLALSPRRDWHADIRADLTELFVDRAGRYGRFYAHRRLGRDLLSLWRGTWRGGRMFQDLRFALRLMRRNPAPVAICVGGLALAIAVATTAFTLVNASMLRPYGVADPASLVSIFEVDPGHSSRPFPWMPYPRFLEMRARTGLVRLEASTIEKVRFTGRPAEDGNPAADGGPSRYALFVSGGYLEMLGARPFLGRPLLPADEAPGAARAAVVSHHVWSTDLAADPGVVGRTVWLNNVPVTLVGVLERTFSAPGSVRPAVWTPLVIAHEIKGGAAYGSRSGGLVSVIGRLSAGTSRGAAESSMSALLNSLLRSPDKPDAPARSARLFAAATPMDGPDAGESYLALACLVLGLGLIVALACANTANLLLAAATTRGREIGVRLALGASRKRLAAQLVTESAVLGVFAGALAYLIAQALTPAVSSLIQL